MCVCVCVTHVNAGEAVGQVCVCVCVTHVNAGEAVGQVCVCVCVCYPCKCGRGCRPGVCVCVCYPCKCGRGCRPGLVRTAPELLWVEPLLSVQNASEPRAMCSETRRLDAKKQTPRPPTDAPAHTHTHTFKSTDHITVNTEAVII